MATSVHDQDEERTVTASTIAEAFRKTATRRPDQVAYRTRDNEISITWSDALARVDELAARFSTLGVGRGEIVAMMITNRPEFHICDLAILTAGATPFSVYHTSPPNQIKHIISNSGARFAIVEEQFLPALLEARAGLPGLETVIVLDGVAPIGTIALTELPAPDPGFDAERSAAAVTPDDLLTLIYTSGTTGPPKGVEITHRAFFAYADGLLDNVPMLRPGSNVISWLPNAHIAERNAHHYLPLLCGMSVTCCQDTRQVLDCVAEVHPGWFFAVPRIWEKLETRAAALLADTPGYDEADLQTSLQKVRLELAGASVPSGLNARCRAADERVFAALRVELGLDRGNYHIGAAPAAPELIEFFLAIGVGVSEIWGMSETTGAGTMNPPGAFKIGRAGKPVRNVEMKLAEDGEMLVRGPIMMRGYRGQPDATTNAYTEDGWFRTGDVGEFDADGYLKIIDRKKELIINAAGKNMSPANIESTIKSASPLIGQICVIGDRRPFNVALIVLDAEYAPRWAAQQGIASTELSALARDDRIRAAIQEGVDRGNAVLSRVERIKYFTIVPYDWPPAGDELTPTMKLKRRSIATKYGPTIDELYDVPAR